MTSLCHRNPNLSKTKYTICINHGSVIKSASVFCSENSSEKLCKGKNYIGLLELVTFKMQIKENIPNFYECFKKIYCRKEDKNVLVLFCDGLMLHRNKHEVLLDRKISWECPQQELSCWKHYCINTPKTWNIKLPKKFRKKLYVAFIDLTNIFTKMLLVNDLFHIFDIK